MKNERKKGRKGGRDGGMEGGRKEILISEWFGRKYLFKENYILEKKKT